LLCWNSWTIMTASAAWSVAEAATDPKASRAVDARFMPLGSAANGAIARRPASRPST
jgi:hypothetical protein